MNTFAASTDTNRSGSASPKRILLIGATGTIGQAVAQSLVKNGHKTVCFVRTKSASASSSPIQLTGTTVRAGDLTNRESIRQDGFAGESFDAVISCIASRTGVAEDAWAIDHRANLLVLEAARTAGVRQFILLSAICVQKPMLAFQHAKLAFERELIASGLTYSIVRPTAYFKSLSGQIDRVRNGKPYLLFGDGRLTSCKPISNGDLADYIVRCLDDPSLQNRILPIGGPGKAITPRQQGEKIFALIGREPKFRHVPVRLLEAIAGSLGIAGFLIPPLTRKAELANIGRYYATESMLVLDPATGRYDADATPSAGSETLYDYYERLIRGDESPERGDHAVF